MWVPLKKDEKQNEVGRGVTEERGGERQILIFFLFLVSFSDLRKSDRMISSGKERKMLYATRATRGYQKHKISPRI